MTWGGDTATMMPRTAEERRLREFLEAQPPAVVYLLIAIMYLGRGDFEAKDLLDQYGDMSEACGNPKAAARQMVVKLPLPDYLEQGLNKLARAGMDVDKLLPGRKPCATRSARDRSAVIAWLFQMLAREVVNTSHAVCPVVQVLPEGLPGEFFLADPLVIPAHAVMHIVE